MQLIGPEHTGRELRCINGATLGHVVFVEDGQFWVRHQNGSHTTMDCLLAPDYCYLYEPKKKPSERIREIELEGTPFGYAPTLEKQFRAIHLFLDEQETKNAAE